MGVTRVRVVSLRSFDPLIAELSPKAFRAWARALEWSCFHGRDGELTAEDLRVVGASPAATQELLQSGVWKLDEQGRTFIAELREGPVVAEVEGSEVEHRAMTNAERQKAYRERKRNTEALRSNVTPSNESYVTGDVTNETQRNVTAVTGGPIGGSGSGSSPDPDSSSVLASDSEDLTGSARDSEPRAKVRAVFECWKVEHKHPKAILERKRDAKIRARLREGFTVEQLCQAIKNAKNDGFLMGENADGRTYDDLESLLRSASKVERLLATTSRLATGRGPAPLREPNPPSRTVFRPEAPDPESLPPQEAHQAAQEALSSLLRPMAANRTESAPASLPVAAIGGRGG